MTTTTISNLYNSYNFPQRRDPQPLNRSKPITIMCQTEEPQEHIHHVSATDFDGISANVATSQQGWQFHAAFLSKTITHPIWNHFEVVFFLINVGNFLRL